MALTPTLPAHWFQILLALADHDLHGLAITKEVFDRTEGRMHLWPGMLYGALKKLADAGLVTETRAPEHFESGFEFAPVVAADVTWTCKQRQTIDPADHRSNSRSCAAA